MLIKPIPYHDPLAAFQAFAADSFSALLDGAAVAGNGVSIIASDPLQTLTADESGVKIDNVAVQGDPFTVLEQELKKRAAPEAGPVPFTGGALGFLGYELGGWLERLPPPRAGLSLPTMAIGIYDTVAAFDAGRNEAWIISHDESGKRAEALWQRLSTAPRRLPELNWAARGGWQPELARSEAELRIRKIIDYIFAGDIFQANFTQRFSACRPAGLDDFTLYRRLRALAPAPFAAFLRCGGAALLGASPERFLRLDRGGNAEAQPIKGTRPRDPDPIRDAALAQALRESAKDHAENLMIVDLMRNDLSRVCAPGSVKVPGLCELESFATVHHLTSTVTGRLRPSAGAVDLLRACFPGGSVTGAPKIRAMEIIHELEPARRGAYCGCYGWIGFDGAMDMSMTIRTLTALGTVAGDMILAQAGGGIVADSDPAAEYEEAMVKIAPLLRALTGERKDESVAERRAS